MRTAKARMNNWLLPSPESVAVFPHSFIHQSVILLCLLLPIMPAFEQDCGSRWCSGKAGRARLASGIGEGLSGWRAPAPPLGDLAPVFFDSGSGQHREGQK